MSKLLANKGKLDVRGNKMSQKFTQYLTLIQTMDKTNAFLPPSVVILDINHAHPARAEIIRWLEASNLTFGCNADSVHIKLGVI